MHSASGVKEPISDFRRALPQFCVIFFIPQIYKFIKLNKSHFIR